LSYGVARLETSFVIYERVSMRKITFCTWVYQLLTTSTPRFRATAMTVFSVPKSTPTTDMFTASQWCGGVEQKGIKWVG
jgi:hypothetical protein